MAVEKRPSVVEGIVIRTALGRVVLCAVGSALMGAAAGFVLWDTWSHQEGEYILPFHLAKDSLFTSFVVGLCLFGGAGCAIAFALQSLFPHRLVLGDEVLQVIRTGVFGQSVITQVPYSNIASVTCEAEEHGFNQLLVGIDLCRPVAPETYSSGEDLSRKVENVRDLYLPGFFTTGAEEIARQIADRCRRKAPAEDS